MARRDLIYKSVLPIALSTLSGETPTVLDSIAPLMPIAVGAFGLWCVAVIAVTAHAMRRHWKRQRRIDQGYFDLIHRQGDQR